MTAIEPAALPASSLLAQHRGPECYRDAFRAAVSQPVSLPQWIGAFYGNPVFTPERLVLRLIGRGADRADIAAMAAGRSTRFAAWSVEARTHEEILLRDFRNSTCSWLAIEPRPSGTVVWFGSGVRNPDAPIVKTLVPFHLWYSRQLLAGAIRHLS